jgi:hypothetical protein
LLFQSGEPVVGSRGSLISAYHVLLYCLFVEDACGLDTRRSWRINCVTTWIAAAPGTSKYFGTSRRAFCFLGKANDDTKSRFNDQILFRCPETLSEALARAADRYVTSMSDYARTAIIKQLHRDGRAAINRGDLMKLIAERRSLWCSHCCFDLSRARHVRSRVRP